MDDDDALVLAKVPPRPGRTRRNLPVEEWRVRIIQSARILFAKRGYEETTMEEIAKLAGISRARMYRIFPGRRELFDAMVAQDARALAGELLLELAQAPDVEGKLRTIVTVLFHFVDSRRERNRLIDTDHGVHDPALTEMMQTVRGAVAETLAQQLSAVWTSPKRPEPAEMRLRAHALIAMAEGAATAWATGPRMDLERSIDIVTEVALRPILGPGVAGM